MDLVEKVLYNNFKTWNEKRTTPNNTINDDFAEYMKEIFQIQDKSLNILDILKMVVVNDESSDAQIVNQNEITCKDKPASELKCKGGNK